MPPQKLPKLLPKVASEATSGSGPSVEATETPGKPETWIIDGTQTSWEQQRRIFFAYKKFQYEGRLLAREEVFEIVPMILGKETVPISALRYKFTKFDNPKDEFTSALEKSCTESCSKNEQQLLEDIFKRYLADNEGAKDRCNNYNGLKTRPPHLGGLAGQIWRPMWDKAKIREDELFLIFALLYFCKDHKGERLEPNYGLDLVQEIVFQGRKEARKSKPPIIQHLQQEDHELTKRIASVMVKDKDIRVHFGGMAHEKHKTFAEEKGLLEPLLDMSRWSQSDLTSTTRSIDALSLTASTSSSNLHTVTDPRQSNQPNTREGTPFNFNEWLNMDEASPSPEASPHPSGTGSHDPQEKAKGKQGRDQESSSSSPGKQGSGKPAEKRPRREGRS